MIQVNVTYFFDEEEVKKVCIDMGCSKYKVGEMIDQYIEGDKHFVMPEIKDSNRRYFHTSGIVALLVTIADELENTKEDEFR